MVNLRTCIKHQGMTINLFHLMLKLLAMSPPEAGNIFDTQPWDSIKDII